MKQTSELPPITPCAPEACPDQAARISTDAYIHEFGMNKIGGSTGLLDELAAEAKAFAGVSERLHCSGKELDSNGHYTCPLGGAVEIVKTRIEIIENNEG